MPFEWDPAKALSSKKRKHGVFAELIDDRIRIISARLATRKERRRHEEEA